MTDQKYFDYLAELRNSGATNMLCAGVYLQRDFGIRSSEAGDIMLRWIKSFEERGTK